jgi:hypothetical protein
VPGKLVTAPPAIPTPVTPTVKKPTGLEMPIK